MPSSSLVEIEVEIEVGVWVEVEMIKFYTRNRNADALIGYSLFMRILGSKIYFYWWPEWVGGRRNGD